MLLVPHQPELEPLLTLWFTRPGRRNMRRRTARSCPPSLILVDHLSFRRELVPSSEVKALFPIRTEPSLVKRSQLHWSANSQPGRRSSPRWPSPYLASSAASVSSACFRRVSTSRFNRCSVSPIRP